MCVCLCVRCTVDFISRRRGILWRTELTITKIWETSHMKTSETDVSLLWSHTRALIQTVFKKNCWRQRDVLVENFLALCTMSWCSHIQHQVRREAMQDFYFEIISLLREVEKTFTLMHFLCAEEAWVGFKSWWSLYWHGFLSVHHLSFFPSFFSLPSPLLFVAFVWSLKV